MKKILILLMVGLCCCGNASAEIINAGIIGNSGERGTTLVRFAERPARGMGVAYDRFGKLWDRAGDGLLNSYALDGRMVGQFNIPKSNDRNDKLTLVGDTLVLKIAGKLYSLKVDAKSGTEVTQMNIEVADISFGTIDDKFAFVDQEGKVFLLNLVTGVKSLITEIPMDNFRSVELAPDGTIYWSDTRNMHKIADGEIVDDWVRQRPGERPQLIDGFWFGHAWHGTIKKFDEDMQPAPGVILGGASGSFIGYLPQNSELSNGRGLVHIRGNLYAVSGIGGVIHLMEWNAKTKKMAIVRRIGSLQNVNGIGLDLKGRIWAVTGSWEWYDRPDTPIRFSINPPEYPGISQAVMLYNDNMVACGFMWGNPCMFAGPLNTELKSYRIQNGFDLRKGAVGSAVYRQDKQLTLLSIDSNGKGQAFYIGSDGKFRSNAGDVTLKTKNDVSDWTSLAMNEDTLMAGADGYVIEFERDGKNWKEISRWNSWGNKPEENFGGEIYISADSGQLWVADSSRQRVLCFDLSNKQLVDSFGQTDVFGAGMHQLDAPTVIMARGKTRAVVFDSGNQRLIKLEK